MGRERGLGGVRLEREERACVHLYKKEGKIEGERGIEIDDEEKVCACLCVCVCVQLSVFESETQGVRQSARQKWKERE